MKRQIARSSITILVLLLLASCSASTPDENSGAASSPARTAPVSLNKDEYCVFTDLDAGASPSVPAEQGGKGFKGEGWETNTSFDLIGDPKAVRAACCAIT